MADYKAIKGWTIQTVSSDPSNITAGDIWYNSTLGKIRGAQLMSHFENMQTDFPDKIKEVRGKGLLTAFEMQNSPHLDGHHVSVELLKHGVYAKETHHSTVRIAPALTIKAWQIDNIAEETEGRARILFGWQLKLVAIVAFLWSLFQLWYASPLPFMVGFGVFIDVPARAIHLGFGLFLAFLLFPFHKKNRSKNCLLYTSPSPRD
mgnify:CR=1 FL=1